MKHDLLKNFNLPRTSRLMTDAIQKFNLCLKGLNILTEAATGYYMLTPIIAALAGAEKVYALTKDSVYGKATDIRDATMSLASQFEMADRIKVIFSRRAAEIGAADVVTNLGHVRPLDKLFLSRLKKTVAIPLMCESWEFRSDDVDLFECRRIGIPLLATDEGHPSLQTFGYVGHLALKLLFELDVEVLNSQVLVLGSGKFGAAVFQSLTNAGASVTQLQTESPKILESEETMVALKESDALVVAEHICRKQLIGRNGYLRGKDLLSLNTGLVIAHIAGDVDASDLRSAGIRYLPEKIAKSGHMSVTTDYLGPRPLIDLHTAGLKIGEIMAWARLKGQDRLNAEKSGLRLGFSKAIA